jgi:hypothetical protein
MDKFKIVGLEGKSRRIVVEAQFSPKEIEIDKAVPWQVQAKKGPADLEFNAGEPMTMDVELLFDGFESASPIQSEIDKLHALSDIDATLKRPPKVKVVWGQEGAEGMMPPFQAVIAALSVKYVMFGANGVPLRATVRLKFKEANDLSVGKPP